MSQTAMAWNGHGTASDPYLLSTTADWRQLAADVRGGEGYSGKVFRMTADIDADSTSVGDDVEHPFRGTFDGDGFTLTFNKGTVSEGSIIFASEVCAPFVYVSGATIRHLRTTGTIFTSFPYAAGIVASVFGAEPTKLYDCLSDMDISGSSAASSTTHGGLVGVVAQGGLEVSMCLFTGNLSAVNSAGLVGATTVDITIDNSMVAPAPGVFLKDGATFVHTFDGATADLRRCYCTRHLEGQGVATQGEPVFSYLRVPDGCSYHLESEPDVYFGGKAYWRSGAVVTLTAPDDVPFDHWDGSVFGCFVSDPWTRNGPHVLRDIAEGMEIKISTSMPAAKKEKTMDGTRYRYLSGSDYHLYLSDEELQERGYQFEDDYKSGYLIKYSGENADTKCYMTAVVGWEAGDIPADGAQIHNDLSGDWADYTLLACIAPHAFEGCMELKTLYFKDTDATHYNAQGGFCFSIGERAFAGCTNMTELKMMQYTTRGDNHWEYISPSQVTAVAANAFDGSPDVRVSCHRQVYQDYLSSSVWTPFRNRVIVYDATVDDFTIDGVRYHQYRNQDETRELTNSDKQEMMDNHVRIWAADYQQLNPASLLTTNDNAPVYYTSVVGADNDYLDSHDGKMVILNDLGTYHNYKTICLGRNALRGNEHVRSIEFRQVNGDMTSRSDLKMVIQNGAFKGCKNLRELRLFYWCEDGTDHWEVLGPENVIPGDNIFGKEWPDDPASLSDEELRQAVGVPADFKILVSPSRLEDFMADPNWQPYLCYMEAVDYDPTAQNKDFTMSGHPGVTYGFITTPGGITESSATVSQDVSWWTAPRIAVEVALYALSIKSLVQAINAATAINLVPTLDAQVTAATNELLRVTEAQNYLQYINEFLQSAVSGIRSFQGVFSGGYASANIELLLKELPEEVVDQAVKSGLILKFGSNRILNTMASEEVFKQFGLEVAKEMEAMLRWQTLTINARRGAQQAAITALAAARAPAMEAAKRLPLHKVLASLNGGLAASITTAGYLSAKSWGGSGTYNGDLLQKGMRENIISNMHQVGLSGGGYIITTPVKNLVHHTYIKKVADDVTHAVIYAGTDRGQGHNANTRTMALGRYAFRDHKQLTHVSFHESNVTTNEAIPMLLTIPDSAFVGCDHLQELRLLVETDGHGTRALGPESFILGGDSIFAGLSPETFHIVIDPSRRQDFLDNESWQPLERFFVYEPAQPNTEYNEYGAKYAYAYENGSVQKVHKVMGHKIEHTVVTGATTESGKYLLSEHQGALKLCNDIGSYNNYQLDAVSPGAFKGNRDLRVVYFTDLYGQGAFGDSYTGLDMVLGDSCFAHCKNLADVDLIYIVTDGDNHLEPIKPDQVKIGRGVLDGTTARLKMMPQQVAWFEADSTWATYRDRFMPCVIQPGDPAVLSLLEDMTYYDMAATGYDTKLWTGYIDLARIAGVGFQWLDGRFKGNTEVRSFPDFEYFGSVGLDYVGDEWFRGCSGLSDIRLPRTLRRLGGAAFEGCALTTVELPDSVEFIGGRAFFGCPLRTVIVRGRQPARMDSNPFPYHDDLHIYVPSGTVAAYREAWPDYAPYIYDESWQPDVKEVLLTKAGTLADKLGLSVEWSYSGAIAGDEPRFLYGCYSQYDSLTVSGPLNDLDLAVLRYLAGCDSYTRGGRHTDGRLRHLNLYDARIVKDDDCKAHYVNLSWGLSSEWRAVSRDNELPHSLFHNCTALESVVLPRSLTSIGPRIFEGCSSLKRVAVTGSIGNYVESHWLKGLLDYPLEELTLVTDSPARSENSDPWGHPVGQVYTLKSQLADYMGQPYLVKQAMSITAPFADEAVMTVLARRGRFFPSDYALGKSAEGLFDNNSEITTLDEFACFTGVTYLDRTFRNARSLQRVALPASITRISSDAFEGCSRLDTIRVACDSVPQLGDEAFRDLPSTFSILVPKQLCKLYRATWPQYADHINPDNSVYADDTLVVVHTTEPNTLARHLGLEVTYDTHTALANHDHGSSAHVTFLCGVRGDYSHVRRLKVVGPVSGGDLALLRYIAGFCPWANTRNFSATLEYLDLYDAQLIASEYEAASDMYWAPRAIGMNSYVKHDNQLPSFAFLECYKLRTLILPRTLTHIATRALQECENLETLVIGDETTDINWSAFDDDASLSRLYLLSKRKPTLDMDNWLWRNLCNNYHPTFDAFYVRPSIYNDYLYDAAYTGDTWQRTNNISRGTFTDDASFCAFASHAAATRDDLLAVESVERWFDGHPGVRDLTALSYTSIDSLSAATLAPLTQLERVALPPTLMAIGDGAFNQARDLRYADLLLCDSTLVVDRLRDGGLQRLGLDTERTLVYVPSKYGDTDETNVVVLNGTELHAAAYRLADGRDYCVPYPFETTGVAHDRTMPQGVEVCSICLPFAMDLPEGVKAYELGGREGATLTFRQVEGGHIKALKPYLLRFSTADGQLKLHDDEPQVIPASSGLRTEDGGRDGNYGYIMRGTLQSVSNEMARDIEALLLQADGRWYPMPADTDEAYIPAFRNFLIASGGNSAVRRLDMVFDDDSTSAVETITTVDSDGTERTYDLNGRQLPTGRAHGIVISGGKKHYVK